MGASGGRWRQVAEPGLREHVEHIVETAIFDFVLELAERLEGDKLARSRYNKRHGGQLDDLAFVRRWRPSGPSAFKNGAIPSSLFGYPLKTARRGAAGSP